MVERSLASAGKSFRVAFRVAAVLCWAGCIVSAFWLLTTGRGRGDATADTLLEMVFAAFVSGVLLFATGSWVESFSCAVAEILERVSKEKTG